MSTVDKKYTVDALLYSTIGFIVGCCELGYMTLYPNSWLAQNDLKAFIWFPVFLVFIFEWRKMKLKKARSSMT